VTKNCNFRNSRWRRLPSWKSLFWPLLINRLSDLSEILYEKAERHADKGYKTKMQMCKIQDGGRPPFWKSLNRHQWKIVRFWWNLVHYIIYWTQLQSRDQKLQVLKFKMAAAAIFKIVFWPLLINRLSDFSTILYEKAERHADKGYGTKMQMCKIQDGRRPPFWKSLNRHISVKNCQILMKFGTLNQILNPVTVTWPKNEIFGIQNGGNRNFEICFFGHNSSTDCPISAKFCMRKQNVMPTKATW